MVTKSYRTKRASFVLAGLLIICLFMSGCGDAGIVKQSQLLLGTIVDITVADLDSGRTAKERAIKAAFDEIRRIEGLMSLYKEGSDIWKVNKYAYLRPIEVHNDTIKVIKKADELNGLTGGAFDITVGPLLVLWGFASGGKSEQIPTDEEIQHTLERVGADKLRLNVAGRKVNFTSPDVAVDLSGIAKGYAVDKAIEVLKKQGIKNAMVNAGGDIYCMGKGPWGRGWKIGIRHPRQAGKILTTVVLKDKAIATSGDYEKFFFWNNRRISHIIDPRTGMPVSNVPDSVTITAADCMTADALATAVFVLGPVEGLKVLDKAGAVDAMIVVDSTKGIKVYKTDGFGKE